jgi:lycopene cyclase domain-containing protein
LRQTIALKPSLQSQRSWDSFSGLAHPASLSSISQENLAGLGAKRRKTLKSTPVSFPLSTRNTHFLSLSAQFEEGIRLEYLAILASVFLFFLGLKLKHRIQLFRSTKEALLFFLACLAIGVAWDSYAIFRGHWSFGEQFFAGIKLGLMPVEEYLFILIIPFSVLVLYKTITEK